MQRMFWFQLGGGALALQPRTWGGHANLQFVGWRFYANVGTSSQVSPRFMRVLRARWYGEAQLHCALALTTDHRLRLTRRISPHRDERYRHRDLDQT